jgi:putative hydrolase of the HAD superfamily
MYHGDDRSKITVPQFTTIFWDVGGVLLSNAWDRAQRERALRQFGLDEEEFHDRHEMVISSFERGKITLDEYLDRTVFYRARSFTRNEFRRYMLQLSQAQPEVLELAQRLANSGRYLMATINNESRELNAYRLQTFGLDKIFTLFVSSCYVGFRKPEPDIYRMALEITQRPGEECVFIDDRPINLETAQRFGMHTIELSDAAQLGLELQKLGIEWPSAA